ncbi:MAG TPA: nuclear transport factor 2 family protein [Flavitalea sp.]|nr:nuclear transport factor 2 family protein [Flavitalea sp.]
MQKQICISAFFLVAILTTELSVAQSRCHPKDSVAIRKVINEFNDAWTAKDPVRYAAVFANDADWENAFGGHLRGRDTIQKTYQKMMLQFTTAVETITRIQVFCMSPDFALVDIYQTVDGQKLPKSGRVVPTRHLRMSDVYQKKNGDWQVKVHRVTDLREMGQNQNVNQTDSSKIITPKEVTGN